MISLSERMPLFRRELLRIVRLRRSFWLLWVLVAVVALFIGIAWREASVGEGAKVLAVFAFLQLGLALLLLPAVTASAISGEREEGTYDLLFTTLLSPAGIALSKAGAVLGYIGMLLVAPAPIACAIYLLGGVRFESMLVVYGVSAAAIVSSALVCLVESARTPTTARAAVRGTIGILFWQLGFWLLLLLVVFLVFDDRGTGLSSGTWQFLMGLSPWPAIGAELWSATSIWPVYLVYAGVLSVVSLVRLIVFARRPEIGSSPRSERRAERASWIRTTAGVPSRPRPPRRVCGLARGLVGLGRKGVPLLSRPMAQVEIVSGPLSRWLSVTGTIVLPVVGFALLLPVDHERLYAGLVGGGTIVLLVLHTAASGATIVCKETTRGTLDLLRGTQLSAGGVLFGKYVALVVAGLPMLAVCLAFLLISEARDWRDWGDLHNGAFILGFFLVIVPSLTFTAAVVVWSSVLVARSGAALAVAFGTLFGLLVILPFVLGIATHKEELVVAVSPFGAFFKMLEEWRHDRESHGEVVGFLIMNLSGTFVFYGLAHAIYRSKYEVDPIVADSIRS